jgi:hypothetical protein
MRDSLNQTLKVDSIVGITQGIKFGIVRQVGEQCIVEVNGEEMTVESSDLIKIPVAPFTKFQDFMSQVNNQ